MVEHVIAPELRYSQHFYEESLRELVNSATVWLDIGCGHQVLPEWRLQAESELVNTASHVVGVDVDSAALTEHRSIRDLKMGSVERLPFADDSFNLVTANMVVEHLENPVCAFREVRRVLRTGGVFLFHTPNLHGYITMVNRILPHRISRFAAKLLDGRDSRDVYPAYYRCNLARIIRGVAVESQLDVKWIRHIPTTAVFARVLPLAVLELLLIRATMRESMAGFRTNLLCLLAK